MPNRVEEQQTVTIVQIVSNSSQKTHSKITTATDTNVTKQNDFNKQNAHVREQAGTSFFVLYNSL